MPKILERVKGFFKGDGRSIEDVATGMATKAVNKTMGKRIAKMSLERQVKVCRRLMKLPGGGIDNTRTNLIKGLPDDMKGMAHEGKSKEEIKAYYWGCLPFRELWCELFRDTKMPEGMLDTLIEEALG